MTVFDLLARNAAKFPDQEALCCEGRRQTWQLLHGRALRLAGALAGRGIRKGDKVAIFLENCDQFVEIYFALAGLGAVGVPLNYRLTGNELSSILQNSESQALFYGARYRDTVQAVRSDLPLLGLCIEVGPSGGPYEEFLAGGKGSPAVTVREDDPNLILYTSGTTGRPKGAVLSHANSIWNALNMVVECGFRHEDRCIIVPPLYHSAALNCWFLAHAFMGAASVVETSFQPAALLRRLTEETITNLFLVPAMYNFLLQQASTTEYDFSGVRIIATGASVMPVALKEGVRRLFPSAGIIDVYGLTEAGPGVTILKPADAFRKAGSVGKALVTVEVRLVDGSGRDVPCGGVGEIIVRGPTVMQEYYNLPEATRDALKDGWLYSGDLARTDEEGFLYLVDRKKDMVNSGGENVYPAEIEAVLAAHPGIMEVAVIGVPDPRWGEAVCAVVVPRSGESLTVAGVLEFTTGKLAGFKKPRRVVFTDVLPRNPSGKVLKTVLREKYGAEEATQLVQRV
ncbi:MAG TPA: long-chain fatty acid--CoA ligase [Spirochaetia bacterium]|nr:long-chain fatty acid--CoA ligase [Spirochaetia bacterium]